MADRRMFSKGIIDSDAFLDMPQSAQNLYFHLCMRADDDGFVNNPKKVQRTVNCGDDDAKILCAKNFVIPFESGVIVIKHWRMHNYLRADRYKPTAYQDELACLTVKPNGAYTCEAGIPTVAAPVYQCETQVRLGKVSIDKDRREKKADKPPIPSEAVALASLLFTLHQEKIDKGKKRPSDSILRSWAEDIDKLNRIDGRPWGDIEKVIRWVKDSNFWAPNIQSGSKLREKFDTVYAQMLDKGRGSSRPPKVTERTAFLDMEEK